MNTVVKIVYNKYSIQVKFENDWQTMCEQTNKQTNKQTNQPTNQTRPDQTKPNQTKPNQQTSTNKQTCQDRSITLHWERGSPSEETLLLGS